MHLEMCEMTFDPHECKKDVERFINDYLRLDGLFVIRLLTLHTGVIFGTELVQSLWINYFGYEGTALKRCSSFPDDIKEFSPTKNNKKFAFVDDSESHISRNRRHRFSSNKSPKISLVNTSEQLLHPPTFSPTTKKRELDSIEYSRTSSISSSRTGSPLPDFIEKKEIKQFNVKNNSTNQNKNKLFIQSSHQNNPQIEDLFPSSKQLNKQEERNQKEIIINDDSTTSSSINNKYITARNSLSSS